MAHHVVGQHAGVPGLGESGNALLPSRGLEDRLHTCTMTPRPRLVIQTVRSIRTCVRARDAVP